MQYQLTESLEDYLLEIFIISQEKTNIRIKDIAKHPAYVRIVTAGHIALDPPIFQLLIMFAFNTVRQEIIGFFVGPEIFQQLDRLFLMFGLRTDGVHRRGDGWTFYK